MSIALRVEGGGLRKVGLGGVGLRGDLTNIKGLI